MRITYKKRILVDNRKKITTGYKGTSKSGKEIPKKADHFVLSNPETGEVFFPELIEFYGNEPKELFVLFPSDELSDFYNDDYNLWTSTHNLKRRCDGQTCLHVCDDTIEIEGKERKFAAGEETDCICDKYKLKENDKTKKYACRCDMLLKAYILNPHTSRVISPICYLFYSGSVNTADNIRSQLSSFKKFKGIPFKLYIKEVKKNNQTFYLWGIVPYLTTEQLIAYQYEDNIALTDGSPLLLEESTETESEDKQPDAQIEDVEFEDVTDNDSLFAPETPKTEYEKFIDDIPGMNDRDISIRIAILLESCKTINELQTLGQKMLSEPLLSLYKDFITQTGKLIKTQIEGANNG